MNITRRLLRDWGACYDDERIASLVPPEGLTPLQVLDLDIPAADRLWVVLREEVMPAKELRLLACDWAEAACRNAGHSDPRSLEAINVSRRFAHGKATHEELDAARHTAWYTTAAARHAAAWNAANGARAAARHAATWTTTQIQDVRKTLERIGR